MEGFEEEEEVPSALWDSSMALMSSFYFGDENGEDGQYMSGMEDSKLSKVKKKVLK